MCIRAEKIKGITIELNGDATGLDKAISKATSGLSGMQKELREVEKGLKLTPDSILLLEQKQDLLTKSIAKSSDKLDVLQEAYKQVQQQVSAGTLGEEKLRAVERAIVNTEAEIRTYQSTLEGATKKLDDLASSAEDAGNQVENLGSDFGETVGKVERFADVATGEALMGIGDRLGAAGDKVKEFGQNLIDLNNEYDNATRKASAYFSESGEAAEKTASVIKNVFKSGLGDSMDAVSDAVITVKKNIKDLDETSLEKITSQAIILDQTYGIDMNETLRGVNSLMEQFHMSAEEAMDYIVTGTQNGLDKTNELGDNLSEYAGKFAQAGYSAKEYFQLLDNGLDNGAYNLDKVNDAINEVTTRLADGTIADNIKLYSKDTQDLLKAWTQGEASQKDVIDSIVSDIQNTTNQQEALNMAAEAFGTMAEDGSLKFIGALTSTGDAYDDVIGKAQELNDATTSDSQMMTAAWREIQIALLPLAQKLTEIALEIIPPLAEKISSILSFLSENPTIANIALAIGAVVAVLGTLIPIITTITGIVTAFGTAVLAPAAGIILGIVGAIAAIVAIISNWGAITEWFGGVWNTVCTALMSVWESVKSFFAGVPEWWTGIWNQVKEFFASTWDALKAKATEALTSIVEGIRSKFTSARETISSIWTGIKSWLLETVESIKTNIVQAFENIVNGVREKASQVSQAVESGLQAAISFISGLPAKFLTWGKDMIDNLVRGIRNGISAVGEAVKSVADKISAFLHFTEPDEGPLSNFHTFMPDMIKLMVAGIEAGIPDIAKASEELAEAVSPEGNIGIGASLAEGIASSIRGKKEYAKKSAAEIADAVVKAAQEKLDNYKVYNDLTLREEAEYWDAVRKQTDEGTQARIDADEKYFKAKKDLNSKMETAEKQYTENIAKAYESLNDKIQSLNKEYQSAVDSRTDEIRNAYGLFDEFDDETDLTSDDLLNNLQSQVDGLKEWRKNLNNLSKRGISDELLNELQEMGPKSAAQVRLLTEMTDDELDDYVSLFAQKNRIARRQAVSELEPMQADIASQIASLKAGTQRELAEYQQEYISAMTELGLAINKPAEEMKLTMAQNAVELVSTLAGTMQSESGSTENMEKYKTLAENILKASNDLPNDMQNIGKNTVQAMIDGIRSKEMELYALVQSIALNISAVMQEALGLGPIDAPELAFSGITNARSVWQSSDSAGSHYSMNDVISILSNYLPEIAKQKYVVMDGKKVVGQTASEMDKVLGSRQALQGRING